MTHHGNACVNQMNVAGQTVTGPQLDLTAWPSGLGTDTLPQRVAGYPIAVDLGGPPLSLACGAVA